MMNRKTKGLSLLLALALLLSMCVGMSVTSFAANDVGLTAAFTETNLTASSEAQTVHLRIGLTAPVEVSSVGFKVSVPTNWELIGFNSIENSGVTITAADYDLPSGTVVWMTSDMQNTTINALAECVYTVPANTSGEFTVNITECDLAKDFSTVYVMNHGSASATLTIASAPVAVSSITLNKNTLALTVGGSETLTATVKPDDATNKNVTWESSDPKVATVDENGKVTAVKAGTATITVKSVSNNTVTNTCEVTVTDQPVSVTGVALTPDKATLNVGETQKLTVEFAPTNATNKHVTWVSSNEAVATVADGIVTAVGKGTATITVTTEDGNHTATCEITVKIPVSGVTLNPTSTALVVGDTKQLTATVEPANADDSTVTWKSSDTNVATVDQNGNVTAVGVGSTTITATAGGKNATCKIAVTAKPVPIEGIALSNAEVSVGRIIQLEPVFTPANTTQRDLKWSSSNNMIATIDANGRVRGVAEGKVTITATSTVNSTISAACVVTVTPAKDDPVVPGIGAIIGALGNGSLPFNDVTARDYFYDAVKWAVDQGITSGTSRYTFSPDAPCTRAQVVTFLWRAAGCPQPTSKSNPFTDVRADDYFYTAVLWAVENGITNGTSAKTFSPDATVTRAQVVTFLWRANGQPAAGNSGFLDVSSNAYYARAVDWAFANGITTGVDYGAFGPDTACTRAQIVTFLYRAR